MNRFSGNTLFLSDPMLSFHCHLKGVEKGKRGKKG